MLGKLDVQLWICWFINSGFHNGFTYQVLLDQTKCFFTLLIVLNWVWNPVVSYRVTIWNVIVKLNPMMDMEHPNMVIQFSASAYLKSFLYDCRKNIKKYIQR